MIQFEGNLTFLPFLTNLFYINSVASLKSSHLISEIDLIEAGYEN